MERENYFILLGLCFDPVENNSAKIEKAIQKKLGNWEFIKNNNPAKRDEAARFLELAEDMKKVMLTPELRQEESIQALKIKRGKLEAVRKDVKKLLLGGPPSQAAKRKLARDYEKFGYTLGEIDAIIEGEG